jgi:hypothetical protein
LVIDFHALGAGFQHHVGQVQLLLEQALAGTQVDFTQLAQGLEAALGHFIIGIEHLVLHDNVSVQCHHSGIGAVQHCCIAA